MHNNKSCKLCLVAYTTKNCTWIFFWGGDRYSKYAVRKHSGEITAYGKEINTRKKEIHVEI